MGQFAYGGRCPDAEEWGARMEIFKALRGAAVATCIALGLLAVAASGAMAASPIFLCIGTKAGQGVKSGGTEGKCPLPTEKVTFNKVALPSEESEQQKLLAILPYIKYVASGVGGKPTIQFSGANLQVVSGLSSEEAVNGAGNLIVGNDELPGAQTGSNNLMLGYGQTYTSFGSLLGGYANIATGPLSVVFGAGNNVTHESSSVTGGTGNEASAYGSTVSGGFLNKATNYHATVSGGQENIASGASDSVSAGRENTASGEWDSVSGGKHNEARGLYTSVYGSSNEAIGFENGFLPHW